MEETLVIGLLQDIDEVTVDKAVGREAVLQFVHGTHDGVIHSSFIVMQGDDLGVLLIKDQVRDIGKGGEELCIHLVYIKLQHVLVGRVGLGKEGVPGLVVAVQE